MEKTTPLVSTQWLKTALGAQQDPTAAQSTWAKLRVLDATWLGLSTEGRDWYKSAHIPGSFHFDLNECRVKTSDFNFTVPTPQEFARYVGDELGIDNDTHVVVYENDPIFRIMSAPRVWWMFRLFGHDKVSVLNGGLKQWKADGYPVESGDAPQVERRDFAARSRSNIIRRFDEVLANVETAEFTLVDARKAEWFDGSMPSIWPGIKLGHIKKVVTVPFDTFIYQDNDCMIGPDEIREVFQKYGLDLQSPIVSTCFVGICACTIALGAFIVGKEDVAIYDGSWDEFSKKAPTDSFVIIPDPRI